MDIKKNSLIVISGTAVLMYLSLRMENSFNLKTLIILAILSFLNIFLLVKTLRSLFQRKPGSEDMKLVGLFAMGKFLTISGSMFYLTQIERNYSLFFVAAFFLHLIMISMIYRFDFS